MIGITIYDIPNSQHPEVLFWRNIGKKVHFMDFLKNKGHFFESRFYSKQPNALNFALIVATPFSWAACCNNSRQKFFAGQKENRHSPLPTTFLNFYAPFLHMFLFLRDPFASCLAALATSQSTGSESFGSRKFSAGEFFSKTIEKRYFFRGQVLLYCISLDYCPMCGIPMLVRRLNKKR